MRRTTLAPRGQAPPLYQAGRSRQKVSVVAALCRSPVRGHARLLYQTCPNANVDGESYAEFLRDLVHRVRGPIVVVHDRGRIHRGVAMDELWEDFPWLAVHDFPAYSPKLNPTEFVFTHAKSHTLANYAPHDVRELDDTLHDTFGALVHTQDLLQSCFRKAELPW